MKIKEEIAQKYLDLLSNGKTEKIIGLFSEKGRVHSPIYGDKSAEEFFRLLSRDTIDSNLKLKGIFQEDDSTKIALYFEYTWTLRSGKTVVFDVVDIMTLDHQNKITELKIIYDTIIVRSLITEIKT